MSQARFRCRTTPIPFFETSMRFALETFLGRCPPKQWLHHDLVHPWPNHGVARAAQRYPISSGLWLAAPGYANPTIQVVRASRSCLAIALLNRLCFPAGPTQSLPVWRSLDVGAPCLSRLYCYLHSLGPISRYQCAGLSDPRKPSAHWQ